jgi:hypothetical protein
MSCDRRSKLNTKPATMSLSLTLLSALATSLVAVVPVLLQPVHAVRIGRKGHASRFVDRSAQDAQYKSNEQDNDVNVQNQNVTVTGGSLNLDDVIDGMNALTVDGSISADQTTENSLFLHSEDDDNDLIQQGRHYGNSQNHDDSDWHLGPGLLALGEKANITEGTGKHQLGNHVGNQMGNHLGKNHGPNRDILKGMGVVVGAAWTLAFGVVAIQECFKEKTDQQPDPYQTPKPERRLRKYRRRPLKPYIESNISKHLQTRKYQRQDFRERTSVALPDRLSSEYDSPGSPEASENSNPSGPSIQMTPGNAMNGCAMNFGATNFAWGGSFPTSYHKMHHMKVRAPGRSTRNSGITSNQSPERERDSGITSNHSTAAAITKANGESGST